MSAIIQLYRIWDARLFPNVLLALDSGEDFEDSTNGNGSDDKEISQFLHQLPLTSIYPQDQRYTHQTGLCKDCVTITGKSDSTCSCHPTPSFQFVNHLCFKYCCDDVQFARNRTHRSCAGEWFDRAHQTTTLLTGNRSLQPQLALSIPPDPSFQLQGILMNRLRSTPPMARREQLSTIDFPCQIQFVRNQLCAGHYLGESSLIEYSICYLLSIKCVSFITVWVAMCTATCLETVQHNGLY